MKTDYKPNLFTITKQLLDQFLQYGNSSVHNSSKVSNYRIFKTDYKFEEYLIFWMNKVPFLYVNLELHLTNYKFPIEKGRWSNIPREIRYCELCQENNIVDEYHYILECTNLSEKRKSLLPKHLIKRPNIIKL
jgi:hypothetical protein